MSSPSWVKLMAPRHVTSCHHMSSPSWVKLMASRHHIAQDPTTCINEDMKTQGINKASPTWLHHLQELHHKQRGSISTITINHTINVLKGPSSAHQPYKGPLGSSTYLQGSNRVKTMTIMSTSINQAASYYDHCKGHHQVTRLHITVVGIKDNHQSGVGINDNLQ
jgi:hypothetical protein